MSSVFCPDHQAPLMPVSFMHKFSVHGNEAANCEHMPITVDMLGEIKRDQTE